MRKRTPIFGERIWIVLDCLFLTIFTPAFYVVVSAPHFRIGAAAAAIVSGFAVATGLNFRKGLLNLRA